MLKWSLLVVMSVTILMMLTLPGLYDSRRTQQAFSRYRNSPSALTERQVEDAKAADWRDIAIYEAVFAVLLAASTVAYLRVAKNAVHHREEAI